MKSKLTIDFQGIDVMPRGNALKPLIRATVEDSEDVRDGLMKCFFEELGGESNWLNVDIWNTGIDNKRVINITPVTPYQLLDHAELMIHRVSKEERAIWLNDQLQKSLTGLPIGFLENKLV